MGSVGGGQEVVLGWERAEAAEGCGECSATGGGRGQLEKLGSRVVSWAGSVTDKPKLAHAPYISCINQCLTESRSLGSHKKPQILSRLLLEH